MQVVHTAGHSGDPRWRHLTFGDDGQAWFSILEKAVAGPAPSGGRFLANGATATFLPRLEKPKIVQTIPLPRQRVRLLAVNPKRWTEKEPIAWLSRVAGLSKGLGQNLKPQRPSAS